ncbi:hypothetical protein QFZ47_002897 [Variovorax paradoxus]|nr:hypothetical protein [Variovorax paradoxus]
MPAGLDGGERAHRAAVVHAEDALQVLVGLQDVFGDGERGGALLLAVLRAHHLDAGVLGERFAAALHALQDRHHRNAVEDGHVAFLADALREVFAGEAARVGVLRTDEGVDRPLRIGIHRHHDQPRLLGRAHGRLHAGGVGRVQQQDVDLLLDHVLHVADLLGHVVPGIGGDHGCADAGCGFLERLLHRHEVGVVELLEGHADAQRLLRCLRLRGGGTESQSGDEGGGFEKVLHGGCLLGL